MALNIPPELLNAVKVAGTQIASKSARTLESKLAENATDTETPVKQSFLGKAANAAGKLMSVAAPFIPGGGAAKLALKFIPDILQKISGNDDEWFEEFHSAGATFNEFLALGSEGRESRPVIAALASIKTVINNSDEFTDQFMPSVQAYIRNKTDNILVDDVSKYTDAFIEGSRLYAHYYTGMKYIKLSEKQPLNIPLLTEVVSPIAPKYYSQFRGVVDSLGDYLKTTVRLPHAWVEYLRWRFGTTFLSENTGKPGLVTYDIGPDVLGNNVTPYVDRFEEAVKAIKSAYASAGRAGSDLKLAYDDHNVRWDVEDPHYDAKEFCLRINSAEASEGIKNDETTDYRYLDLDSRLDMNAAVQAVTMSCGCTNQAFPIEKVDVAFYNSEQFGWSFSFEDGEYDDEASAYEWNLPVDISMSLDAGWYVAPVKLNYPGIGKNLTQTLGAVCVEGGTSNTILTGILPADYTTLTAEADDRSKYLIASSLTVDTSVFSVETVKDAAKDWLIKFIAQMGMDSLQFHNSGNEVRLGHVSGYSTVINFTKLAYDTAKVAYSQLNAIQRTAIRNLTRGNYKATTPQGNRPEVKEAAAGLKKTVVDEVMP